MDEKDMMMSYQCEVQEKAAQPAMSIRTRAPVQELGQALGKSFAAIWKHLGELGEAPAGPPFAAYYNEDMQDLDVEIGFPVSRRLPGKDDIEASEIPGGKVATCIHTGLYSEIEQAYNALSRWMQENGYEATGVAYEVYLNDPSETPPKELQTQIAFPLKMA
jgi:effector-binding domain-containing protein